MAALRKLARFLRFIAIFVAVLYFGQSLLIFPGTVAALYHSALKPRPQPIDISKFLVETEDNKELVVWKMSAAGVGAKRPEVVILFHGNGDDLHSFYPVQQWFAGRGLTNYSFDYRGYGDSSGWPTEKGLAMDATAVWKFVSEREKISADKVVIVGYSIGGAVASELARRIQPRMLLLLAPFSSISSQLSRHPLLRYLRKLANYDFPVAKYVSELGSTCFTVVFSDRDEIVPAEESRLVLEAYKGSNAARSVMAGAASHGSLFYSAQSSIEQELDRCLSTTVKASS